MNTVPTTDDTKQKDVTINDALFEQNCKIKSCKCLNCIVDALKIHKKFNNINKTAIQINNRSKFLEILNSYYHIIDIHLSHKNTTEICKNYQVIYDIIEQHIGQCKLSHCNGFRRNRRLLNTQRSTINTQQYNMDIDEMCYKETLDTLHCYFMHGFDSGMRLRFSDLEQITEKKYGGDKNNDVDIEYNNITMRRLNRIIKDRQKGNETLLARQNNKFFTKIINKSSNEDEKDNDHEQNEEEEEEQKISDSLSYNFGHKYYYWSSMRYNEEDDTGPNIGYKKKYWYIHGKYTNLKEEILMNEIHKLDINTFDQCFVKAGYKMKSQFAKQLKIDSKYSELFCKKSNEPISVNNILSIILYTDNDTLSYKFSSTFRPLNSKNGVESNAKMKYRNAEYWNWSQILSETVELYGSAICNTRIKHYYHGVSFMTFPSFVSHFCGPTSTTTSMAVAQNFGSYGIILDLVAENEYSCLKLFDCRYLSRLSWEEERLFIGGDKPLKFSNIILSETMTSLQSYVRALTVFDYAMQGRAYEGYFDPENDYEIVGELLQHFDGRIEYQNNEYPKYVMDLFKTFCDSKKQISINFEIMDNNYPGFKDYLVLYDVKLIAIDFIAMIFRNCETINIYGGSIDANSKYLAKLLWMSKQVNNLNVKWLKTINIYSIWEIKCKQFASKFQSIAQCQIAINTDFMSTDSCLTITRNYVNN